MNISKTSLFTWYQMALPAVEGLQKDQSSADTKLPIMSVETETEKEYRNF